MERGIRNIGQQLTGYDHQLLQSNQLSALIRGSYLGNIDRYGGRRPADRHAENKTKENHPVNVRRHRGAYRADGKKHRQPQNNFLSARRIRQIARKQRAKGGAE